MKTVRASLSAFLLALPILSLTALPEIAEAQANVVGEWRTLPYPMPINPIHVGLMHTGKVVVAAGSENDPATTGRRAAVWDPVLGTITVQYIPWDFFCNGMSFLPDGRLLVTGGTLTYDPFYGLRTTTIFDPATEKFIQAQDMAHGRWYPTNTALGDGRTTTFSGLSETYGSINNTVEIYTVPWGWSPEFVAPWTPPLYPRLHLVPDGRLFFSGSAPDSRFFDPVTGTWTPPVASTNYGQERQFGSSILLPLLPETGYTPRVMIMGGNNSDWAPPEIILGSNPATASAEIIDLSQPAPRWRFIAPMSAPRVQMNAVILPTGKVLALGGSVMNEDATTASLAADLFDPTTETWSPAGVATYPRLYHSVALLLPDATVWTAGSNPYRGFYEQHMEIYSPAYLFTTGFLGQVVPATRPTISAAPAKVGYGASFPVSTPDAADIASIALIRPGASTHAFDMEQRMVGLAFSVGPGDALTVTSPPDVNIAPPGYYMLFLVNRRGVPSVATFIQLSLTPKNQPPTGTITSPTRDVTIQAGQAASFDGTGTDADGFITGYSWIFPGGIPATSSSATPGPVVFSAAGTYIASLTVTDNAGENDPSPPTHKVTVLPGQPAASSPAPATLPTTTVSGTWLLLARTDTPKVAIEKDLFASIGPLRLTQLRSEMAAQQRPESHH